MFGTEDSQLLDLKLQAENDDADAQYNLGVMYEIGQGVTEDFGEALKWYRKAADQGDTSAQNNLTEMYDKGQGVE